MFRITYYVTISYNAYLSIYSACSQRRRRNSLSGETFEDDFISPIAKRRRLCSLNSSQSSLYDNFTKNVDFNDFETASEESFTTTPLETTPQQTSQQSNSSQLLGLSCCGSRCLARLSLLELESCRKTFQNRTYVEQRQYLLDTLSVTALCTEGEEGSKNLECNQLKLAGKSLCKVAFLRVLEVSEKRMRNVTRLYVEGATISRPRLYLQRRNSSKLSTAVAWMERYFNRLGDKMPHLQQLHLPSFLSKKMVYELMVQDLSDEGLCKPDIISSSHFYAVWKDKFHNCIIPKVREYMYVCMYKVAIILPTYNLYKILLYTYDYATYALSSLTIYQCTTITPRQKRK